MYCIYPYLNLKEYRKNVDGESVCDPDKCPKKEANEGKIYWGKVWAPSKRCAYVRMEAPHNALEKKMSLTNCLQVCPSCGVGMKRTYIAVSMFKRHWRTAKPKRKQKHMPFGYVCMGCGKTVLSDDYNQLKKLYGGT